MAGQVEMVAVINAQFHSQFYISLCTMQYNIYASTLIHLQIQGQIIYYHNQMGKTTSREVKRGPCQSILSWQSVCSIVQNAHIIIKLLMSIEIGRIIQVYDQCIAILQARGELFLSQTPSLTLNIASHPHHTSATDQLYESCPKLITNYLHAVLKVWSKQLTTLKDLQISNNNCIHELQEKMDGLKNNTALLTKQEQLISEAQNAIKEWNSIKDPLVYYDIKKRLNFKEQLSAKVNEIKTNSAKTKQSAAPLYLRKIQEEFKYFIYQLYLDSSKIDVVAKDIALSSWRNVIVKISNQGKEYNKIDVIKFIQNQKNEYYEKYYELLSKKQKVSYEKFSEYFKHINSSVKRITKFWHNYVKQLNHLNQIIQGYLQLFKKCKQLLQAKQVNIAKSLQKTSQTVSAVFNIEMIISLLASQNKIFLIIPLLSKLFAWASNIKLNAQSNLRNCQQYEQRIPQQIARRQKQFHVLCIQDKNFLEAQSKLEVLINKKLFQGYIDFLTACYNIGKDNSKNLEKTTFQKYQSHQIGGIFTKQIISYSKSQSSNNKNFSKSQYSDSSNPDNKNEKAQKLSQIQILLSKLQVFDSNTVNWADYNIYSCSLGPRLLLVGKLALLSEGLYFQSFFNKKNIFFGKTKIFVPKSEILQTNNYNATVLPNAIELKTPSGSMYFHAFSSRTKIDEAINQIYFPENNPNELGQIQQIQFKQVNQKEAEVYSAAQTTEMLKLQQNLIVQKTFKGINLARFFRRYFSDDQFQIRGQKYQNFKTYFMLQIQAIDPKSTPLTPQIPSYFMYKIQEGNSKNFPKISERYHTYKKAMPKIPFLSSGGEGLCEDKQRYYWISSKIFVIEIISKVKGFSLTQNMEIVTKTICKEENLNEVKISLSTRVKFTTQSGTNNLIKGPALSSLKQSMAKMMDIIEKYQKGKKGRHSKSSESKYTEGNEELQQALEKFTTQNKKLKKIIRLGFIGFIAFYIMTILLILSFY